MTRTSKLTHTLPLLPRASKAILFATSALTLAVILMSAPTVSADTPEPSARPSITEIEPPREVSINDAETGSLMFRTDAAGRYVNAPMVSTDVGVSIAGPIIRSTVSQTFKNTSDQWVEGVYVFPLPENAAVDHLRMVIGGRMIEGQIKEKKQAREIYEQAKAEGRKASLVEQQRPNIFTASVANIGPGESVSIQIEYQDKAEIQAGTFAMSFPMVVGPRFSPKPEIIEVATTNGSQMAVLDPVLDRHAITPPVMNPVDEPIEYLRLPVTMNITLDAGFDLDSIKSAYHEIDIDRIDDDSASITLSDGAIPANRDFKLEWEPKDSLEPYSALFSQTVGEDTYLLSMLTPPKSETIEIESHARESIFIIDTSGSMGGTSLEQAKDALLIGIDHLETGDRFNIIRFSTSHSTLFNQPVDVTPNTLKRARAYVNDLETDGGTNMSPAINEALRKQGDGNGRLQQIIFITDGNVGNEKQLFAQIKDDLGDARMFPVSIGSAPNSYFMSRAAKFGRGSFVQIGDINEVAERMGTLFAKLDNPVLTDLTHNLSGASFPSRLPDIYEGDPVISVTKVRTEDLPKTLKLSGELSGGDWAASQTVNEAEIANGLSVLWARAKIADLEESRFSRADADKIDGEILTTALDHHIVSRLTSLVAVDVTPSRNIKEPLSSQAVPTMLPEGWDFAKVDGNSLPARQMRAAPVSGQAAPASQFAPMPGTATPQQILLWLGLMLMAVSGVLAKIIRPRQA